MFDNSFINRVVHKTLWLLLLPACMLWPAVAAMSSRASPKPVPMAPELPSQWQGRPVWPLALGHVEQRFANRFPGSLARLTDGQRVLVVRTALQPTRMLHPAADCYRALGWGIGAQLLELDREQHLWRCFAAQRRGQRLRVCERIVDAQGRGFTDASAWYWAALLGESQGPWQAITVAGPP